MRHDSESTAPHHGLAFAQTTACWLNTPISVRRHIGKLTTYVITGQQEYRTVNLLDGHSSNGLSTDTEGHRLGRAQARMGTDSERREIGRMQTRKRTEWRHEVTRGVRRVGANSGHVGEYILPSTRSHKGTGNLARSHKTTCASQHRSNAGACWGELSDTILACI